VTPLVLSLALIAALVCAVATVLYLRAAWVLARATVFERLEPRAPNSWPRLSVIVSARDEAATIEPAIMTLLAQDYPELEVIAVDDRSTDGTGATLDRLAARHAGLHVLHVRELPPGWLGKVHAMHVGTEAARGDWLLYTDADVHFAPAALRRAVAHAIAANLDHLAIVPTDVARGFWLRVVIATFLIGFLCTVGSTPGAAVGAGAFNLVRRSALTASRGWQWLRLEVADDVGLAAMIANSGGRCSFALSAREIGIDWYPSIGATLAGFEKNFFAVVRYSLVRLFAMTALATLYLAAPILALALSVPWLWLGALGVGVGIVVIAVVFHRAVGYPILPVLLTPIGQLVLIVAFLRSGLAALRRGAIVWRDTAYPLAELRAGQRVHW
jgi:glycosyltransferase involved in cell wall biosynthesis